MISTSPWLRATAIAPLALLVSCGAHPSPREGADDVANAAKVQSAATDTDPAGEYCLRTMTVTHACNFGAFAGSSIGNSSSTEFALRRLGFWRSPPTLVREARKYNCYGGSGACDISLTQSTPDFSNNVCKLLPKDEEFLAPPPDQSAVFASAEDGEQTRDFPGVSLDVSTSGKECCYQFGRTRAETVPLGDPIKCPAACPREAPYRWASTMRCYPYPEGLFPEADDPDRTEPLCSGAPDSAKCNECYASGGGVACRCEQLQGASREKCECLGGGGGATCNRPKCEGPTPFRHESDGACRATPERSPNPRARPPIPGGKPGVPQADDRRGGGQAGEPVELMLGTWFDQIDLLALSGRGIRIDVALKYSTLSVAREIGTKAIGVGWTLSYDRRLSFDGPRAYLLAEDGETYTFTATAPGSPVFVQEGANAARERVERTAQGEGIYVRRDGTRERYDASGELVSIEDRLGNALDFVWTTEGELSVRSIRNRVTGQAIELVHQGVPGDPSRLRLHAVRDAAANRAPADTTPLREVKLEYDEVGRLAAIRDVFGNAYRYGYDGLRIVRAWDRLADPNDPNAPGLVNTYDVQRPARVVQQDRGNGVTMTFDWRPVSSGDVQYDLVIYQFGNGTSITTRYLHDASRRIVRHYHPFWDKPFAEQSFDPDTGYLARVKDLEGRVTTYAYDPETIDLTSVTTAVGTPIAATTRMRYGVFGTLERLEHADGRVTAHVYDERGVRLESRALGLCPNAAAACADAARPVESTLFETNAFGEVSATVDASGARTCFVRNDFGRIVRVVHAATPDCASSALALESRSEWDFRGYLTRTVDERGLVTSYERRLDGTLAALVEDDRPGGRRVRSTLRYDAEGNVVEVVDDVGGAGHINRTMRFAYALVGGEYDYKPIEKVYPTGLVERFEYDGIGELREARQIGVLPDGGDRVARLSFRPEGFGWRKTATQPDGTMLRDERFDPGGRLVELRDGRGVTHRFAYDAAGRLATRTLGVTGASGQPAVSAVYEERYDAGGRPTLTLGPNNTRIQRTYDAFGRLSSVVDAAGHRTDYVQSTADRTVAVVAGAEDPTHAVTTVTRFDEVGRPVREEVDPLGRKIATAWRYARTGNAFDVHEREAAGATTRTTHDVFGRLVGVEDALGSAFQLDYDDLGRLRTRMDARGRVVEFAHDAAGNLLSRTEYLRDVVEQPSRTELWTYGSDGTVRTRTDFAGQTTEYAYDTNGRLSSIDYAPLDPARDDVRFTYAPSGRLLAVEDPKGTTSYTYDALDRLVERRRVFVGESSGDVVTHTYDAADRLQAIVQTGGQAIRYATDDGGWLTHLTPWGETKPANNTHFFTSAGALLRVAAAPSLLAENTVEPNTGILLGQRHAIGAAAFHVLDYRDPDPFGRTQWIRDRGGITRVDRDPLGRVTQVDEGSVTTTYGYDVTGNRTRQNGVEVAAFDDRDRIAGYEYDANDNLLFDGRTRFTYDSDNRLVRSDAPGIVVEYEHDGLGQLVAQTVNGVRSRFLLDETGPHARVVEVWRGDERTYFGYGPAGVAVRMTTANDTPGPIEYAMVDRLGSVRDWVRADGTITERLDYDVWGAVRQRCQPTPRPTPTPAPPAPSLRPILLITGPADTEHAAPLRNVLTSSGAFLERDQGAVTTSEIRSAATIVLSDTINSWELLDRPGLRAALRETRATLIVLESHLLDDLGMAGFERWSDYGVEDGVSDVTTETGETLRILEPSGKVHWGVPASTARVLAFLGPEKKRAAWFEYAEDAVLVDGSRAAGKRIHFFHTAEGGAASRATPLHLRLLASVLGASPAQAAPSPCIPIARVEGFVGFAGEWHSPNGTIHLRAREYLPALGRFLQRDTFEGFAARPASLNRFTYAENDPVGLVDPSGHFALPRFPMVGGWPGYAPPTLEQLEEKAERVRDAFNDAADGFRDGVLERPRRGCRRSPEDFLRNAPYDIGHTLGGIDPATFVGTGAIGPKVPNGAGLSRGLGDAVRGALERAFPKAVTRELAGPGGAVSVGRNADGKPFVGIKAQGGISITSEGVKPSLGKPSVGSKPSPEGPAGVSVTGTGSYSDGAASSVSGSATYTPGQGVKVGTTWSQGGVSSDGSATIKEPSASGPSLGCTASISVCIGPGVKRSPIVEVEPGPGDFLYRP
jgi:RHS repeat-associated protein